MSMMNPHLQSHQMIHPYHQHQYHCHLHCHHQYSKSMHDHDASHQKIAPPWIHDASTCCHTSAYDPHTPLPNPPMPPTYDHASSQWPPPPKARSVHGYAHYDQSTPSPTACCTKRSIDPSPESPNETILHSFDHTRDPTPHQHHHHHPSCHHHCHPHYPHHHSKETTSRRPEQPWPYGDSPTTHCSPHSMCAAHQTPQDHTGHCTTPHTPPSLTSPHHPPPTTPNYQPKHDPRPSQYPHPHSSQQYPSAHQSPTTNETSHPTCPSARPPHQHGP